MNEQDVVLLKEIQKNADMGIQAINRISEKSMDEQFSRQLARQSIGYGERFQQAAKELVEADEECYRGNRMQSMMLSGAIESSTMLNTSTSHLAELVIQGSNRGIIDTFKVLKHNRKADNKYVEMAKELMDFEEKNIERLKDFL